MGRGEYYKNKYGGGGRGRGRGRGSDGGGGRGRDGSRGRGGGGRGGGSHTGAHRPASGGGTYDDLRRCLRTINGQQYGAYHDLDTPLNRGWVNQQEGYTLYIERAQSDSFSPPTRCRIHLDKAAVTGFPAELYSNPIRAMALSDYLLRALHDTCKRLGADGRLDDKGGNNGGGGGGGWGGPKGGDIQILAPCQHVLEQSAVTVDPQGSILVQLTVNLPARGRTILGDVAETILGSTLTTLVQRALCFKALNGARIKTHVELVEDQLWLQGQLESRNLVAFIRNGANLPRQSGVDDRPLQSNGEAKVILFQSPSTLETTFTLPNAGITLSGMGIPKGISLICGGGFHGKSTLLGALQVGIYPKIGGDGREYCMMAPSAFKVRAEDGRQVQSVDISSFINNLPFAKDTTCFSSLDASGSTSQATNIVEGVEMGSKVLLMDEDTCATNFMIRDEKMMQLVAPDKEPITPFVQVVRSLYDGFGVSSILVVGGVGDYFDVADHVLLLDCYHCSDATEQAKTIVANYNKNKSPSKHGLTGFHAVRHRVLSPKSLAVDGKVRVPTQNTINYGGGVDIDLSGLEQLVSKAQAVAIANALQQLASSSATPMTLQESMDALDRQLDQAGLNSLAPTKCDGAMARPRKLEVAGAINRLRLPNLFK